MSSDIKKFKPKSIQLNAGRRCILNYPSDELIFGTLESEGKRGCIIKLDKPYGGALRIVVKNDLIHLI